MHLILIDNSERSSCPCAKHKMNITQFNDALVSLVEFAAANNNHIEKKDVELYFKNIITDDSMYNSIYSYLKENKITIDDIDNEEITPLPNFTNDEKEVEQFVPDDDISISLDMYNDELNSLGPISEEEKISLVNQLCSGDSSVSSRLAEVYLPKVVEIAKKFSGKGLPLSDLIQEGNIGLIIGISEFDKEAYEFDAYIIAKIDSAIDEAVNAQISAKRVGSHLADRMNNLDDISRDLTEKLGHAPSVEELALEMNISKEEVETIIQTSLNVLSVNPEDEAE